MGGGGIIATGTDPSVCGCGCDGGIEDCDTMKSAVVAKFGNCCCCTSGWSGNKVPSSVPKLVVHGNSGKVGISSVVGIASATRGGEAVGAAEKLSPSKASRDSRNCESLMVAKFTMFNICVVAVDDESFLALLPEPVAPLAPKSLPFPIPLPPWTRPPWEGSSMLELSIGGGCC